MSEKAGVTESDAGGPMTFDLRLVPCDFSVPSQLARSCLTFHRRSRRLAFSTHSASPEKRIKAAQIRQNDTR